MCGLTEKMFSIGCFLYHSEYGYGEITTVDENNYLVFIDFRRGHCDWFSVSYLQKCVGNGIFPASNAFIRVKFKEGDNLKDILHGYSDYRYVHILF